MPVPDLTPGARAVSASVSTVTERLAALSTLVGEVGADLVSRLPHPVPAVLSGLTDAIGAFGEVAPVFGMQLDAVVREISAQRLSLQALGAELEALDSQLAVLERSLTTAQAWAHDLAAITGASLTGHRDPEGPAGP